MKKLSDLDSADRLLLLEVRGRYRRDETGIYGLDVERERLHLVAQLTGGEGKRHHYWLPDVSTWTGQELVYTARLKGTASLDGEGNQRQVSPVDRIEALSRDGRSALYLRNEKVDGARFTALGVGPLDAPPPPLIRRQRYSEPDQPWQIVAPIWNPYLGRSDFIVRTQRGRGQDLVKLSQEIFRVGEDGEPRRAFAIPTDLPFNPPKFHLVRPDDGGIVLRTSKAELEFFDWTGERRGGVSLEAYQQARYARLGDHANSVFQLMAWSDDSENLAIVLDHCRSEDRDRDCAATILLADRELQQSRVLVSIPYMGFLRQILWSPDAAFVGFLGKGLVEGRLEHDQLYLVEVATGAVQHINPDNGLAIHRAHWVR